MVFILGNLPLLFNYFFLSKFIEQRKGNSLYYLFSVFITPYPKWMAQESILPLIYVLICVSKLLGILSSHSRHTDKFTNTLAGTQALTDIIIFLFTYSFNLLVCIRCVQKFSVVYFHFFKKWSCWKPAFSPSLDMSNLAMYPVRIEFIAVHEVIFLFYNDFYSFITEEFFMAFISGKKYSTFDSINFWHL